MIYLDYHAATPLCEAARQVMANAAPEAFANPSSVHAAGRAARRWVEGARDQLAQAIGASSGELVWTSGGTEACNMAIAGLAVGMRRVVTSAVEHPAVREACARLPIEREIVSPHALVDALDGLALDAETLVAVQWVNHETGTRFPIEAISTRCAEVGARLFVDASQALGRVPIDVSTLSGVDALAVASHKIGGPSGAGALWLRRGLTLDSMLVGGGQERGRRAGSPGVEALAGFGAAASVLPDRLATMPTMALWRDRLEEALVTIGAEVNNVMGPAGWAPRVATVTNVSWPNWPSALSVAVLDLEGMCVSAGAACSSGTPQPSAVVAAMTAAAADSTTNARATTALRLSLGPEALTEDQISMAEALLRQVLGR